MALLAIDAIARAQTILLDESGVRWPLAELRLWFDDALREIALIKPTAVARTIVMPLIGGAWQELPAQHMQFLKAVRNLKYVDHVPRAGGRAITMVDRATLDATNPYWSDEGRVPARQEVVNACFDPENPRAFYVYPANNGEGVIEIVVAARIAGIPFSAASTPEGLAVSIDIDDVYVNAFVDYICYRAYSKDSNFIGAAQRAAAHYQQFANALGVRLRNEIAITPNPPPAPVAQGG